MCILEIFGAMFVSVRFLFAPLLVVAASIVARRFGDRVGGWLSAFPFVAFPLLLLLSMDHGCAFGAASAQSALFGIVSLSVFALVYAHVSCRFPWWKTLPAAWIAYLACAAALNRWDAPLPARVALSLAIPFLCRALLPSAVASRGARVQVPPRLDLALRASAAFLLVGSIASASRILGPRWSGLLMPFPVITTILVVFAHFQAGHGAVTRVFRGFLPALSSLAAFLGLLAFSLVPLGIAPAFAMSLAAAIAAQVLALRLS